MQENADLSVSTQSKEREKASAFHVIVLGSGGGPSEDNVTGMLLRSTSKKWSKDSLLAIDAGVHLAAIIRILEKTQPELAAPPRTRIPTPSIDNAFKKPPSYFPDNGRSSPPVSPGTVDIPIINHELEIDDIPMKKSMDFLRYDGGARAKYRIIDGPFSTLEVPFETAKANAAFITRDLVSTYLITHPHLDHLSGFTVNTASFQQTSRPKRIAALPQTIEAIKTHIFNDVIWPNLSDEEGGVGLVTYMRLTEGGNVALGEGNSRGYIEVCDGMTARSLAISHGHCMKKHSHRGSIFGSQVDSSPGGSRRVSRTSLTPDTTYPHGSYGHARNSSFHTQTADGECVTESSAFFVRDEESGKEVLIFGDVEPDSLSLSPRTARVWEDAAPKIAAGQLKAIFIECSYEDSQRDETLFGHLCPRHLIAELRSLAAKVVGSTLGLDSLSNRKRKRQSNGTKMSDDFESRARRTRNPHRSRSLNRGSDISISPLSKLPVFIASDYGPIAEEPMTDNNEDFIPSSFGDAAPLQGLQVFIIHMKDTLSDGPEVGTIILSQLQEHERKVGLGCNFVITKPGASFYL
ncbi:MAG: 3',5'-cyclic-nucleotide phosphodiesterase pde1 [Cirrosporium novae-zelandiae]|nr:MAG: 3',5'-cyclic-nucleotide phosphodiesterase pde1 [Cirrosporium novae-zelandiae]